MGDAGDSVVRFLLEGHDALDRVERGLDELDAQGAGGPAADGLAATLSAVAEAAEALDLETTGSLARAGGELLTRLGAPDGRLLRRLAGVLREGLEAIETRGEEVADASLLAELWERAARPRATTGREGLSPVAAALLEPSEPLGPPPAALVVPAPRPAEETPSPADGRLRDILVRLQVARAAIARIGREGRDRAISVPARLLDVTVSELHEVLGELAGDGPGTRLLDVLPVTARSGTRVAIPRAAVTEVLGVAREDAVETLCGAPVHRHRGRLLPLVVLDRLLEERASDAGGPAHVVVLRDAGQDFGVLVAGAGELERVVVQRLGGRLGRVPLFDGAAVLADGRVAPLLALGELLAAARGEAPAETPAGDPVR